MIDAHPAIFSTTLVHHEVKKHFINVDVSHISAVLYGSHLCGNYGEREVWVPNYLVQTSGIAIIYHPYVIRFFYREKVGEAEDLFPAADMVFLSQLQYLFFLLISGYLSIGSLLCYYKSRLVSGETRLLSVSHRFSELFWPSPKVVYVPRLPNPL